MKYLQKVDWYNSNVVDHRFKLNFSGNTLCILVLNTPHMFEELCLPYLFANFKKNNTTHDDLESTSDLVDSCLSEKFEQVKIKLEARWMNEIEIITLKDYEMQPENLEIPKILMQTCAHISGAAFYYEKVKYLCSKCNCVNMLVFVSCSFVLFTLVIQLKNKINTK